ncbi:MAG: alpha/beta hydrolase, partial [Planctomycetaceae bacterium]|nr:alpha/beta hydrolase [Planctomycetaceae bacterium]
MTLNPRVKQFLDAIAEFSPAPLEQGSVAEARARTVPVLGLFDPVLETRHISIPTRSGEIAARLYVPEPNESETDPRELPVLAYIHGGGWVMGELETYDQLCCALAARSGCAVISLGYRLAPEHPYPAAVEDCIDGVNWLLAEKLNSSADSKHRWCTDPSQVFVMGDSAGGNLAAVVALELNKKQPHALQGQVLIYPITDADFTRESYTENAEGYFLTTAMMTWFWDLYCPNHEQWFDPSLSPIRAVTHAGLPDTFLVTCQYDPLRDEGIAYADVLQAAGVKVDHQHITGFIHGFLRQIHT